MFALVKRSSLKIEGVIVEEVALSHQVALF